jgi:hypothetical protein
MVGEHTLLEPLCLGPERLACEVDVIAAVRSPSAVREERIGEKLPEGDRSLGPL